MLYSEGLFHYNHLVKRFLERQELGLLFLFLILGNTSLLPDLIFYEIMILWLYEIVIFLFSY